MRRPYTKNEPRVVELANQLQNVIDNVKGMKGVIECLNDPDKLYYVCLSISVKPEEETTKEQKYPSCRIETLEGTVTEFIKDTLEDYLNYETDQHSELLKHFNEVAEDGIL